MKLTKIQCKKIVGSFSTSVDVSDTVDVDVDISFEKLLNIIDNLDDDNLDILIEHLKYTKNINPNIEKLDDVFKNEICDKLNKLSIFELYEIEKIYIK